MSAAPVRNLHGKIVAGVSTYSDVTGRKEREREIQRLASFPELNPNPIVEVDTSGRITYSNQAAREVVTELGPPAKLRDLLPAGRRRAAAGSRGLDHQAVLGASTTSGSARSRSASSAPTDCSARTGTATRRRSGRTSS